MPEHPTSIPHDDERVRSRLQTLQFLSSQAIREQSLQPYVNALATLLGIESLSLLELDETEAPRIHSSDATPLEAEKNLRDAMDKALSDTTWQTMSSTVMAHSHIFTLPVMDRDSVIGLLAGIPSPDTLPPSMADLLQVTDCLSTLLVALSTLRHHTMTDSLTGIRNRHYLQSELPRLWDAALRYDQPLALLMIDVDNLKAINDSYGHLEGDMLLTAIARQLTDSVRRSDCPVRWGGDEFVILLPQTSLADARTVAQRIADQVKEACGSHSAFKGDLTCSIGVAVSTPGQPIFTSDDLLRRADEALYRAKASHTENVAVWSPHSSTPELFHP